MILQIAILTGFMIMGFAVGVMIGLSDKDRQRLTMTDKQTIFLTWIVIFTVAFMSMVAVQGHVDMDHN